MRKVKNGWESRKLDLRKRTIVRLNEKTTAYIGGGANTSKACNMEIPSKFIMPDTGCTTQVLTYSTEMCLSSIVCFTYDK
jgi:hypothetical protein